MYHTLKPPSLPIPREHAIYIYVYYYTYAGGRGRGEGGGWKESTSPQKPPFKFKKKNVMNGFGMYVQYKLHMIVYRSRERWGNIFGIITKY